MLFGWALPIIMRKLTKYMGAYTHSRMDRAVVARYFAFLIISQLVIFTLIGVLFSECSRRMHAGLRWCFYGWWLTWTDSSDAATIVIQAIGKHLSFGAILDKLKGELCSCRA